MNHNETEKQKRVKGFIQAFQRITVDVLAGEVEIYEDTENDPPDAVSQDKTIAIEVCEFIRGQQFDKPGGSPLLALANIQSNILKDAQKLYNDAGEKPILVTIHWQHPHDIDAHRQLYSKNKKIIANELVSCVSVNMKGFTGKTLDLSWPELENFSQIKNLVSHISIFLYENNLLKSDWVDAQVAWIGVGITALQPLIDAKEKDLVRYRTEYKSAWLLIVSAGDKITHMAELSIKPDQPQLESTFDAIFYLDIQRDMVFQLK